MNQSEILRQAIFDEPNEDAHRLAYADWLEQNGQAERAEFIRTQVEIAQLPRFSETMVRHSGYDTERYGPGRICCVVDFHIASPVGNPLPAQ